VYRCSNEVNQKTMGLPDKAMRRIRRHCSIRDEDKKMRNNPAMKFEQNKADLAGSFGGCIK